MLGQPGESFSPWHFYEQAPLGARLHVAVRWRLLPFAELLSFAPREGTLLDVGCGHGLWALYAAQSRPKLRVLGMDPDAPRVAAAVALAAQKKLANAHFFCATATSLIEGAGSFATGLDSSALESLDAASLIDVLYLVPHAEQERLLRWLAARLAPGGRLLIKEMADGPRWKRTWNLFQESLAVRLLGLTVGERFHFRSEDSYRELLRRLGLSVTTVRLDRGYVHPHLLIVGERAKK